MTALILHLSFPKVLGSPEVRNKTRRVLDFHGNLGLVKSLSYKRTNIPCRAQIQQMSVTATAMETRWEGEGYCDEKES